MLYGPAYNIVPGKVAGEGEVNRKTNFFSNFAGNTANADTVNTVTANSVMKLEMDGEQAVPALVVGETRQS